LPPDKPESQLWHVPVRVRVKTDRGEEARRLLLTDQETALDLRAKAEWSLVNEGGSGFFRVRYSAELLQALTANAQRLKPIERFGLVSDVWAATVAGLKPLREFVEMARLFRDETDLNVWRALAAGLSYLDMIASGEQRPALAKAVREVVEPAVARLGWHTVAGEDELTRQLRAMLLGIIGTLGEDEEVQRNARELYAKWSGDLARADRDLMPQLISILAYSGDHARYQEFKRNFKAARTPQEEQRYLFSLANFRDPALLKQTMEMTLNGEVRTQNAPFLMHSLLANPVSRYEAWDFVRKNWEMMVQKYPDSALPRMCEAVSGLLDRQEEVNVFFEQHKPRLGQKIIEQHLERLAVAVAFRDREGRNLTATLS
jgi:puromycin-sensitive aminopeptidase